MPRLTSADFVGPTRTSGTQVVYQNCPVCGSDKWKVYLCPVTGRWFCFAGSHSAGGVVDLGMEFSPMASMRDRLAAQQSREIITSWPEIDVPPHTPFGYSALLYLACRGLGADTCAKYGWSEHRTEERILIPFPGPAGTWVYWTARGYRDIVTPKYMSAHGRHPLYVLPRWAPHREVVLVEGVFDAMSVHQHTGLAAIALCGKTLPKYLRPDLLYLASDRIHVILDGDAAGAGLALMRDLNHLRTVRYVNLPTGTDPASLGSAIKGYLL